MGFWDKVGNNDHQSDVTSASEKLPRPVYYVESPEDDTVLVGMNVAIEYYKNGKENVVIINWWDSNPHARRMRASRIKKEGEFFAFKRIDEEGGQTYYFRPMTLDIYNEKVKHRLLGKKDFDNEIDMIKAFLEVLRSW